MYLQLQPEASDYMGFLSLMCLTWTGTCCGKDGGSGSVNVRVNEGPPLCVLACANGTGRDSFKR